MKNLLLTILLLIGSATHAEGSWSNYRNADILSDIVTITARLNAFSGADFVGNKRSLIIQCRRGVLSTIIDWQEYLGNNKSGNFLARIGKKPVQTISTFTLNGDGTTTDVTCLRRGCAGKLLNKWADSNNTILSVRIYDYKEESHSAQFDLTGMKEAIAPIRKACNF